MTDSVHATAQDGLRRHVMEGAKWAHNPEVAGSNPAPYRFSLPPLIEAISGGPEKSIPSPVLGRRGAERPSGRVRDAGQLSDPSRMERNPPEGRGEPPRHIGTDSAQALELHDRREVARDEARRVSVLATTACPCGRGRVRQSERVASTDGSRIGRPRLRAWRSPRPATPEAAR